MELFTGTIVGFAGNFAPREYALCEGQTLAIAVYSQLFAIIGTTYGGDGRSTLGLPDLRGRAPIGSGQGPALSDYQLGKKGGSETESLSIFQMPQHSHVADLNLDTAAVNTNVAVNAASTAANAPDGFNPAGRYWAASPTAGAPQGRVYGDTPDTAMNANAVQVEVTGLSGSVTIENTGSGAAFDIIQPYSVINWIMCLDGTFPPRN